MSSSWPPTVADTVAPGPASTADAELVGALRAGDEDAYLAIVGRHHASMLRVAMLFAPTRAVAEEVVQDTWLAVLDGLHAFEGRSSLRTWIFSILVNRARRRGEREARSVPLSSLQDGVEPGTAAGDAERFSDEPSSWAGRWVSHPRPWAGRVDERLLMAEVQATVRAAIEGLPPAQRAVIVLRDVQGWTAPEVCLTLDLTDGNQRVLLHRARVRVRRALLEYIDGD